MINKIKEVQEILQLLEKKQNVFIGGIPGIGLNTLVRNVVEEFTLSKNKYVITLHPHESYINDYNTIEKYLFEKLKLENQLRNQRIYSLNTFISSLQNKGSLLIVLNKFESWENQKTIMAYLNSFYKAHPTVVTILISSKLSKYISFRETHSSLFFKQVLFSGFKHSYNIFFKELCTQHNLNNDLQKHKEQLIHCSAYHLGLLKAIICAHGDSANLLSEAELIKDYDVKRRIREILFELQNAKISLESIKHNKPNEKYKELGLVYKDKLATIIHSYYQQYETDQQDMFETLTNTEGAIFRILKDSTDYIELDEIAYTLGGTSYEEISNWMLYKHISNLNKKLKNYNLGIKNKRGKGYKIYKTS